MVGMLALVLTFGLVLTGCDEDKENTDPKKITITGLSGKSGSIAVILTDTSAIVAMGQGTISDSVTVSLKQYDKSTHELTDTDWTGTGSYYSQISISGVNGSYLYTNGKTLEELGFSSTADMAKLPKISIDDTTTTIAFDKFVLFEGSPEE
jgi:hypothetical protein